MSDRGLTCKVRPTYVGIRGYTTTDGQVVRVLRREGQVNAPAHLETMKRLTGTRRHPSRDGRRVFLSATAEPGSPAPWDPSVELRPHRDYFAGSLGDAFEIVDVPGMGKVPEFENTITDAECIRAVRDGAVQVSYGYVSYFIDAAEVPIGDDIVGVGEWKNPATGRIEKFDVEGLVDPTDPRIPEDMRPFVGGNHLAYELGTKGTAGRGGPDIRLMLDAVDAAPGCRAMALRKGDAVGGVALASATDDGPACALWLGEPPTIASYASLFALREMHNEYELAPLAMGWPEGQTDNAPAEPEKVDQMADQNGQAGAPAGGAGPDKPTPEMLTAQLAEKTKAYDELLVKYNEAMKMMETLKAQAAGAVEDKTKAVATADALREELAPLREHALSEQRQRDIRLLAAKGELADKINKASADELPAVVVGAHYAANPKMGSVVDGLEGKLKDPSWVRHRYDVLHEQGARAGKGLALVPGVSDAFKDSFVPRETGNGEKKTMQQELDELQKTGA